MTTTCSLAAGLRDRLSTASVVGAWAAIRELSRDLSEHEKTCPVCNGILYKGLWPDKNVEVTK